MFAITYSISKPRLFMLNVIESITVLQQGYCSNKGRVYSYCSPGHQSRSQVRAVFHLCSRGGRFVQPGREMLPWMLVKAGRVFPTLQGRGKGGQELSKDPLFYILCFGLRLCSFAQSGRGIYLCCVPVPCPWEDISFMRPLSKRGFIAHLKCI